MTIKKSAAYSGIAYVALVCQLLTWVGRPLNLNMLVSLSVTATTITVVIAIAFLCMDRNGAVHEGNDISLLAGLFFIVALCAAMTHPINVTLLKKLLIFFQLPVLLMVAKRNHTSRVRDVIYTVNAFYPILCLYYYRSSFSHRYMGAYGETDIDALTLGFGNPNETAIYLMLCAFFLLAAMFRYKSFFKRLILLAEFLWMIYLIYETECRAVIFILTAIVLATIFWRKMDINKKFVRIVFIGAGLFSALLFILPGLGKLTFMGEILDTGRSSLFSYYLDNLSFGSFLIGDFQAYPLANMHNAFLSVLAAFGILSAVAYWAFVCRGFLKACGGKPRNMEQKVLRLSCMAIVIHSAVEASLLTSGAVYAVSTFLVLFMASGTEDEKSV